jgi:hypothetical protein
VRLVRSLWTSKPGEKASCVNPATKLIFLNYRELVTPEEAERYWQIFPPAQAQNVVTITQADAR